MVTHEYGADGLYPHQIGTAILASGNLAIVEPNGEVSNIIDKNDYYSENYTKEWNQ